MSLFTARDVKASKANISPFDALSYENYYEIFKNIKQCKHRQDFCKTHKRAKPLCQEKWHLDSCELQGEGKLLVPFSSKVWKIAWSPNNSLIAAYGSNISIWNIHSGDKMLDLPHSKTEFGNPIAWSPSGNHIAAGCKGKNLRIWNPNDGTVLRECGRFETEVTDIQWIPDGTAFLVKLYFSPNVFIIHPNLTSDNIPNRYEPVMQIEPIQCMADVSHHVSIAKLSPDGSRFFTTSTSYNPTITVWDFKTHDIIKTYEGFEGQIHRSGFLNNGSMFASTLPSRPSTTYHYYAFGGNTDSVRIMDSIDVPYWGAKWFVNPADNAILLINIRHSLYLLDLNTNNRQKVPLPTEEIRLVDSITKWSPDGTMFFTKIIFVNSTLNDRLPVYDKRGNLIKTIVADASEAVWSPDSIFIAIGTFKERGRYTVRVVDIGNQFGP